MQCLAPSQRPTSRAVSAIIRISTHRYLKFLRASWAGCRLVLYPAWRIAVRNRNSLYAGLTPLARAVYGSPFAWFDRGEPFLDVRGPLLRAVAGAAGFFSNVSRSSNARILHH